MNYLEAAMDKLDQSMGDVRDYDHRDRLTRIAEAYAAIAQAQAMERIAKHLENIHDVLDVLAINNG